MEAMRTGGDLDGRGDLEGCADLDVDGVVDWRMAHAALVGLAQRKAGYDAEEARWLMVGRAAKVHAGCGYASYLEYLERVFGYSPRVARERLRVAEALSRLPETMAALDEYVLSWSAVRELSRVATVETEGEWIAAATSKTVREVEDMVSGRVLGDRPDDLPRPEKRVHVVRLELKGATYATFRQLMQEVTREAGHSLSDDEAMQLICGRALGRTDGAGSHGDTPEAHGVAAAGAGVAAEGGAAGQAGTGRARYQIVRGRCTDCERPWQEGGGRTIEIDEVDFEVAGCDAQVIGATHGGRAGRAAQTPPPRTKRAATHRAHGRCEVPGCRHAGWVDVHHIRFRCEGGTHELNNLVVLCSVHHGLVHAGKLLITGRSPALRFFHADGRRYGAPVPVHADGRRYGAPVPVHGDGGRSGAQVPVAPAAPRVVDPDATNPGLATHGGREHTDDGSASDDASTIAATSNNLEPVNDDVVSALVNLGYRRRDAELAVTAAARDMGGQASFDALIRAALARALSSGCRELGPVWELHA